MPPELTTVEMKQLWWFLDGAIMNPYTRHRLWAAWGFCPRHTWAHLSSECELRLLPRGTLILYEDLLGRAVDSLGSRRRWAAQLRATDSCLTCDYLAAGDPQRVERGWLVEAARVNRAYRSSALLAGCREYWEPHTCPECLGGDGVPCRPHLLARAQSGAPLESHERARTRAALADFRSQVDTVSRAISWPRTPVEAHQWAKLVEALGWFAGWRGAADLLGKALQPSTGAGATPSATADLGWPTPAPAPSSRPYPPR